MKPPAEKIMKCAAAEELDAAFELSVEGSGIMRCREDCSTSGRSRQRGDVLGSAGKVDGTSIRLIAT